MKNTGPKSNYKRLNSDLQCPIHTDSGVNPTDGGGALATMRSTRQRYCTMALIMAISAGAALMLAGYPALGKGLILGALFSVLNFILIAATLPKRLGKSRGKTFLFSIFSIYLRYAILAIPLVLAIKQEAFAVSTAAAGLFIVQLAILGDHLLARWRHALEAG